ncbi:MAG: hypothetical protein D6702_01805 [Planctomycetota bacterium]|nr:MAG: hypothetical protein D6702_01805 [Planctomycetota bacterium]
MAAAVLAAVLVLPACNDDQSASARGVHPDVVLRDRLGNPLPAGSTEPYSPRRSCGACHDVDRAANGYHFQQGRTDAAGNIVVGDDFFGDGRAFLRSPGMYGKW